MPQTIEFHLDENVDRSVCRGLRLRNINVTITQEANLLTATDEMQLEFAHSQKRVLFTQDSDFLRLHNSGINHSGIVYCVKGSCSIGEIIRSLTLIWEVLEPEEIRGKVEFI
jgi:predicted nuclease of predicted toxin-antitoxin system